MTALDDAYNELLDTMETIYYLASDPANIDKIREIAARCIFGEVTE